VRSALYSLSLGWLRHTRRLPSREIRRRIPTRVGLYSDVCFFSKSASTWRNSPVRLGKYWTNRDVIEHCHLTSRVDTRASVKKFRIPFVSSEPKTALSVTLACAKCLCGPNGGPLSFAYMRSALLLWYNRTSGGPIAPDDGPLGTHIVWGDEAKPPVFDSGRWLCCMD
jgi:hypothetical protein